jgi:hypothetical protein
MRYAQRLIDITVFEEKVHLAFYSAVCFLVPFMIGHPQLLVGTLVNASLILAATYMKDSKLLPIIMLPSLAVLTRGAVFGPFTSFLVLMIPFIWLGNALLCYTYRYAGRKNKVLGILSGAGLKTVFLFISAYALVSIGAIPAIFLTTMGLFQLYTALSGGALALAIIKGREAKKYF